MTQDTIARIFQPFEQADASISKRFGGTGLGMYITHNLAALMNGSIQIKSKAGEGTSCIVEIPFRRGPQIVETAEITDQGLCSTAINETPPQSRSLQPPPMLSAKISQPPWPPE